MYLFFVGCFVLEGISFVAIVAKLVKNIFLPKSEASIAAPNTDQEQSYGKFSTHFADI
jgi:hypothetical protein